jgi:membrane fusion protein (multidrug efflux system)
VEIRVDTYGRRAFAGHVESLAGASGARFALLPPDNASGNFVKVVQRIPVLVRFDGDPSVPLKPGMSAYVTVSTRTH